ncbi:hypothetical protein [Taibaiella chishuiensis]|uniref:Uncharacterized protein n=1 Tax=Taibaiella chishuiensis TaxID=1434707 RepID=A0A2P8CZH1_9BACT|nr:hypothetical protein [Taibaiella chishuiensis]PSK90365.1 hypothetical protein B0I18_10895 [Taibaiella chishuiensis]
MYIGRIAIFLSFIFFITKHAYGNSAADSFVKNNFCFFLKSGFPDYGNKQFRPVFIAHHQDSIARQKAYSGFFWDDQCKIFRDEKSAFKEDIIDFETVEKSNCKKASVFKKVFVKRARMEVFCYDPYTRDGNTYCRYVFRYRNSYLNLMVKMNSGNKVVRFCYHLLLS